MDIKPLLQEMCTIDPNNSPNFAKWGTLVKSWVSGANSIPASKDSLKPLGAMTKEQFQSVLSDAGVKMTIPDKVTTFVFVQDDESTVIVRVPSKKVVEVIQGQLETLAKGGAAAPYPLPSFYADNWTPPVQQSLNKDQLLTMHRLRIGEYTINTCG